MFVSSVAKISMRTFRKFLNLETAVYLSIGIATIALSFSQTYYDLRHVPNGFVFPLVHNHSEDYYYYLHLMAQGYSGQLTATSWLQPEIFPPRLVNTLFTFLGFLAGITGVSLPVMYTLGRVTGGILLYLGIVILVRITFPNSPYKRIMALILAVFGGIFWEYKNGQFTLPYLIQFWTELDPLVRFSFIPSHLYSKAFMVFTLAAIFSRATYKIKIWFVLVLTFLCGMSSPVVFSIFIPALCFFILFEIIFQSYVRHKLVIPKVIIPAGLSILSALIVSLYHYILMRDVFPWNSYSDWEKFNYFVVTLPQFIAVLGPVFVISIFGFGNAIKTTTGRLYLSWIASGFLTLFVVSKFLPLATNRFLSGYLFIPSAIIAVWGIENISSVISHIFQKLILMMNGNRNTKYRQKSRFYQQLTAAVLMLIIVIYSVPGYLASMQLHERYWQNDCRRWEICPPQQLYDGVVWLSHQFKTGGQTVILTRFAMGGLVAAITGQRVVAAHNVITYDSPGKNSELSAFFSFQNTDLARTILSKYHVAYVLSEVWGDNPEFMEKIGLQPVFINSDVRIYKNTF